MHGGHLSLKNEVVEDPHDLIGKPQSPSSRLEHPKQTRAAIAEHSIGSKCEESGKHQQGADQIADRSKREAARKHGTRQRCQRCERHSCGHPLSKMVLRVQGFSSSNSKGRLCRSEVTAVSRSRVRSGTQWLPAPALTSGAGGVGNARYLAVDILAEVFPDFLGHFEKHPDHFGIELLARPLLNLGLCRVKGL